MDDEFGLDALRRDLAARHPNWTLIVSFNPAEESESYGGFAAVVREEPTQLGAAKAHTAEEAARTAIAVAERNAETERMETN